MKFKKIFLVLLLFLTSACTKETVDESVLGFYNESIYSNPYFDINIKLNSSWDIDTSKVFDEATISSTDLFAQKDGGFSTIYIVVKKLKEIEDEYDLVLRYTDDIKKMLQEDVEILSLDTGSEILGSKEHPYILTDNLYKYDDKVVEVFEKQFILKNGDYIAIINLTTFHEDATEKLVSLFM